jgi:DNA processing protein
VVSERAYWLAWQQVEGIGPHKLHALREAFGTLAEAWTAPQNELSTVSGMGPTLLERIAHHRRKTDPQQVLATWEDTYGSYWTPDDAAYPALLQEIPDTPPVLYYRGKLRATLPAVAIVGTRKPTAYGLSWAERLGKSLAQAGFLVVSGLASGIDTAAHRGALAVQGATAAILGCGVDRCYPSENLALYQQIREQGVIISEHPLRTPPATANFPRRNRIIAGMTQATLVIEAGERSGALITARLAVDYGREVFALPGQLDTPQAAGSLSLMNQGAQLILGIEDILQKLGATTFPAAPTPPPSRPAPPRPELTSLEQHVLAHVSPTPSTLEHLLQQTALGTGEIAATLLLLEVKGLVTQLPGLRYQLCG